MVELPPQFRTNPLSYYLWSRSQRAGHVMAAAIARFIDPSFRWISIRNAPETRSEEERWVGHLVPEERVLEPVSVADIANTPRVSRSTFNSLIRPEGAAADRVAVDQLLLLPERLQRLLEEENPRASPRTLVVANTNRVREFYPSDPERLRAFTQLFSHIGLSIVTTSLPPPYKGRYGFDVVLRLDVANASEWREANLVVEKGLGSTEFRTGASFPPDAIPWYLETGDAIDQLGR